MALVSGEGTDISNNPSLNNRAKRKVISRKMILSLIDVAKEKGEPEREKAYWNTFYCQSTVIVSGNKLYTKYCKNRFCTVCCAIRKADFINRYLPILTKWEDVHFVTLTIKACKAEKLNLMVYGMFRAFKLIRDRCKKRHQRGTGIKLIGIKSLECNFNPIRKTYNPHYHIIVPSKEIAVMLKKEWINIWKSDKELFTYSGAQHIRPVEDLQRDLIETIKYGSKIFTEPDLNKKAKHTLPPIIYARALDNILVAMKGKRIFERFGFSLPKQEPKKRTTKFVENYETWTFPNDATDWINPETGEALTGFLPSSQLSYLLNERINTNHC